MTDPASEDADDDEPSSRSLPDLLDAIGNTPLVPLPDGIAELPPGVRVLLKLESFNPGGSVKDRAARQIVLEAERDGRLKPGATILDASSGNTGIAYALIAAQRGYRLVLCLPKNASAERQRLLAAYGAEIVHTSPLDGTDGAQAMAVRLAAEHPDWVYLNQYDNDANWRAHELTTGPELWRQSRGAITHLVATVGTSGTITGTARFLRTVAPDLRVIEVQPDGPMHGLEGVKHMQSARVPRIYDPHVADQRLGAATECAWAAMRALAKRGILAGPSGGAAVWAAVQVARELERGVVVAILPDSGARYLADAHIWTAPIEEAPCRLAS
jgi:S-sulfo-L-cysteine synthase (O-acetyl-L-serine-dependent)